MAAGTPVFVVANSTTPGDIGTGFISLERSAGRFPDWTGVDSPQAISGPPITVSGYNGSPGTVMLDFDFRHMVTLQVGTDPDHFVVHNGMAGTATGVVWVLTAPPVV